MHYEKDGGLFLVDRGDSDNNLSVVVDEGLLTIGVSQEKAVDSYNDTFTCYYTLSHEEAVALSEFLKQHFP